MSPILLVLLAAPLAPDTEELRIKLPFRTTHECIQPNGGEQSHHAGGVNEFALDFGMPVGTKVCAAAAGRVVAIQDDASEDTPWSEFGEFRNFLWIDHGVGLYTLYGNLQRGSAEVSLGQLVHGGQLLARSGPSEIHEQPHLHFAVTDAGRRSVPLRLLDAAIPKKDRGVPLLGQVCRSDNDWAGVTWFAGDSMLPAETFGERLRVTSPIPASGLRWSESYVVRGVLSAEARKVCLFFTRPPGTHAIANRMASVSPEGEFELSFRPSDFGSVLTETGYRYALAPVDRDGSFASDVTVDFVILEREPFAGLRMNLPFAEGTTSAFQRLTTESAEGEAEVLLFALPKETDVLAVAQGRVAAVGTDAELPLPALSKARRTSYVTIDHGYGVFTTCFGLLADSVRVVPGEVVQAGHAIARSHKSDLGRELHLGFALSDVRFRTSRATFEEQEGDGDEGELRSANGGDGPHVFSRDSTLGAADFEANGVEILSTLPASAWHAGTTYLVEGAVTGEAEEVAFLARQPGKKKIVARFAAPVGADGSFRTEVRLEDARLPKGDGSLVYAVAAQEKQGGADATTWLPLAAIR